jgi:hypothetical protein
MIQERYRFHLQEPSQNQTRQAAADTSRTARGRGKVRSRFAESKATNLTGNLSLGPNPRTARTKENRACAPYREREKQAGAESAGARQISGAAAGSPKKKSNRKR